MSPANNFNRTTRKYFVYIVIAMLAALIYANRKSFVKVAGGGADAGACETLCGEALQAVPKGAYLFLPDGNVKMDNGVTFTGEDAALAKKQVCSGLAGGASAAPATAPVRRR